jgi:hypothetical protein
VQLFRKKEIIVFGPTQTGTSSHTVALKSNRGPTGVLIIIDTTQSTRRVTAGVENNVIPIHDPLLPCPRCCVRPCSDHDILGAIDGLVEDLLALAGRGANTHRSE